jgi:hypothetical protein
MIPWLFAKETTLANQPKSAESSGNALARRIEETIVKAIDKAVLTRWKPAKKRAATGNGATTEERIHQVKRLFSQELAALGAVAGGASAAPGAGTARAVAMGLAELSWTTVRLTDMILTIAVIHGHGRASVEERRAMVLAVLAFGSGAYARFNKLAGEFGKGLGKQATRQIPATTLQAMNKALGRTIVTKYGTKRGAITLGQSLPFGIGATIGGGANFLMVRLLAAHADRFFRQLPYGGDGNGVPTAPTSGPPDDSSSESKALPAPATSPSSKVHRPVEIGPVTTMR